MSMAKQDTCQQAANRANAGLARGAGHPAGACNCPHATTANPCLPPTVITKLNAMTHS